MRLEVLDALLQIVNPRVQFVEFVAKDDALEGVLDPRHRGSESVILGLEALESRA
ncbi:MAG TPA: hypothetical protein VNL91_06380 [Thermoanaerobaculia bacterium]|nr:hypothetical protein [Thermoanaerobaculia bacterium]